MTTGIQFGTGFNNQQSLDGYQGFNLALNPQKFNLGMGDNPNVDPGTQGFGFQNPNDNTQFGQGGFSTGMKNFSLGAQGLAALYGAYNARKLLKQGERQFDAEKDIINRNLANESLAYNDVIKQRLKMSQRQRGVDPNSAEGQAEIAALSTRLVDGRPVV